jgi:hypothetical protein
MLGFGMYLLSAAPQHHGSDQGKIRLIAGRITERR